MQDTLGWNCIEFMQEGYIRHGNEKYQLGEF